MLKAIEKKAEELGQEEKDRPRKMREEAIDNLKNLVCTKEELEIPKIKKIIEKFTGKINKASPKDIEDIKEKQKTHTKAEELKLRDEVKDYKFNNNALFYGAPRTGKSVMAEKLAYEANKYPLVVIQGSALTPLDDFGFEREENGEVKYILFIDEANQINTSTLLQEPTKLTFLKECMGEKEDQGNRQQQNSNQQPNQPPKKLESFEGKFINPRQPKIEQTTEVIGNNLIITANKISEDISKALETKLNELNQTANQTRQTIQSSQTAMSNTLSQIMGEIRDLGAACVIATGGAAAPLLIATVGGGVAGHLIGNKVEQEEKKVKNQAKDLELKSQTIETLKKDNEKLQAEKIKENQKLQEIEKKIKNRDKEIEEATRKSKDPNLSDEDRKKWKNRLQVLLNQQEDDKKERDSIINAIKQIEERIKDNNKNITTVGSGSSDKGTIMEFMVDSKKEKQQEELRAFGRYFPEGNRREGVLSEIKKDLEKIKKINDHEKKLQEINFALSKHRTNESHARTHYFNGKLNEINIRNSVLSHAVKNITKNENASSAFKSSKVNTATILPKMTIKNSAQKNALTTITAKPAILAPLKP
ncbi:14911_t:CDS:2 [Entrophospora sp. SA101]|nr:14911_t:CDS:2 [Entrophospora sp. SA101]